VFSLREETITEVIFGSNFFFKNLPAYNKAGEDINVGRSMEVVLTIEARL
jgi:hypothetical protein